jgi:transposase
MEHASLVPDESLPDDPLVLKRMIQELLPSLRRSDRENEPLRHRLDLLLKRRYGPRSEKSAGPGRFDGIDPPEEPIPPPEPAAEPEPQPPPPKRNGHGRQPLSRALPRERIDHDLSAAEQLCPCCRTPRVQIGEDISEQLDYRPASLFIVERHRAKYVGRACESARSESPDSPTTHQTAPLPPQPIDQGMPAAGRLAHVVTGKYADHLPLHRLEGILARLGVTISRSTLCHGMAAAAQLD